MTEQKVYWQDMSGSLTREINSLSRRLSEEREVQGGIIPPDYSPALPQSERLTRASSWQSPIWGAD